jgi:hypothetical protein
VAEESNWTRTNFWADGSYRGSKIRMGNAKRYGSPQLEDWAPDLASDFHTYANTAEAWIKKTHGPNRWLWRWRRYWARYWARKMATVAFNNVERLNGALAPFAAHPEIWARDLTPTQLADQLDVLQSVFLASGQRADFKRAEICLDMGLRLVSYNCGVSLHTEGLLHCGAARAYQWNGQTELQERHLNKALVVAHRLLNELDGSIDEPPKSVRPDQFEVARQTARIMRKVAELELSWDKDLSAKYRAVFEHLVNITNTTNQQFRFA